MSEMYGFWFDTDGKRLERLHPWELAEAKRLWHKYADIRTGNIQPEDYDSSYHWNQYARVLANPDSSGRGSDRGPPPGFGTS